MKFYSGFLSKKNCDLLYLPTAREQGATQNRTDRAQQNTTQLGLKLRLRFRNIGLKFRAENRAEVRLKFFNIGFTQ